MTEYSSSSNNLISPLEKYKSINYESPGTLKICNESLLKDLSCKNIKIRELFLQLWSTKLVDIWNESTGYGLFGGKIPYLCW